MADELNIFRHFVASIGSLALTAGGSHVRGNPRDFMDRDQLERYFHAAVAAAQPGRAVAHHLPERPKGRTVVVGAGKASAQMARAFEQAWDGPIDDSLVVTRYGYGTACERMEGVEAAHPVPDMAGYLAARRMLEKLSGLGHDDL